MIVKTWMNGSGEACRRIMTRDDDDIALCNDKLVTLATPVNVNYIIVIIIIIVLH